MWLFDVHQFELPEKEVIDWDKTKREIGSMLSSYLVSRERMGLTRMPPIHSTYSLLEQDIPEIKHSSFVQENQQFKQEFLYFHRLFSLGLTAISHPYKPKFPIGDGRFFWCVFSTDYQSITWAIASIIRKMWSSMTLNLDYCSLRMLCLFWL